jgi:phosphatidylglycerophosphate synthase
VVSGSVVNPANAITATRMAALGPLWYFIHTGERQVALVILIVAALMDLVDGWVAKRFRCQTQFGEVFDAIADGVLYGSALVLLAAYAWAPGWAVAAIFAMGILNSAFRYIYARRVGRPTNYQSIAMERFVGYTAFLIAFALIGYETEYYFTLAAALMVVILVHDAKRMLLDPVPA